MSSQVEYDQSYNTIQCSNNETYEERASGWSCKCRVGYNGKNCDDCDNGYVKTIDNLCLPPICVENNLQCNGSGTCQKTNTLTSCLCDKNFDVNTKCRKCKQGSVYVNGNCIKLTNSLNITVISIIISAILIFIIATIVGIRIIVKLRQLKITTNISSNVDFDSKVVFVKSYV